MKQHISPLTGMILLSCVVALAQSAATRGEDPRRAKQSEQSEKLSRENDSQAKEKDEEKDEFQPRLPNYYGQIGITQRQRKVIYTIQRRYHGRIAELERRLKALEADRDKKIHNVLTPLQKKLLERRKEEARLRREARKKARQGSDK